MDNKKIVDILDEAYYDAYVDYNSTAIKVAIKNSFFTRGFNGIESIKKSKDRGYDSKNGSVLEKFMINILKERGIKLIGLQSKNRTLIEGCITKKTEEFIRNTFDRKYFNEIKAKQKKENKKLKEEISTLYKKKTNKKGSHLKPIDKLKKIKDLIPNIYYEQLFNRIKNNENYFENFSKKIFSKLNEIINEKTKYKDKKHIKTEVDLICEIDGIIYILEIKFGGKLDNKSSSQNKRDLMNAYAILKEQYPCKKIIPLIAIAENNKIDGLYNMFTKEEILSGDDFFSFIVGRDMTHQVDEIFNRSLFNSIASDQKLIENELLLFLKEYKDKDIQYYNSIFKISIQNITNQELYNFLKHDIINGLELDIINEEYKNFLKNEKFRDFFF